MGEASASFGNSQNYDEENPTRNKTTDKPKKKPKRGSKGPSDDGEKSSRRGSTPREPKYKCELCSFSTAYLYSINRHAIKVHKDTVTQPDGSIKPCFEKLETKKEPVALPSLFSSPTTTATTTTTSVPSQEFDGLQEFNNIVDSLGVSTSTQWSDPSTSADQLGPIKFATTDGTQINIFRTEYAPFGQNDSHFITFEKADESSATVGDTLLNGYLGHGLHPHAAPPQEHKFLPLSTSSSLGNSSQHSQHAPDIKTENDASNGPGIQRNAASSPKKPSKSKKRKSSMGTSDSGNDDVSSDGKGGPEKKKRKQNAPVSLIKSTVPKCPLCNFSSKYPSNTGRHFQSVHKTECKEVLEGRLILEGIVKKEDKIEKPQQSPPKKKKPPSKKPVELKIPQVAAPSSQDYSDNSGMASQNPPGPTPAEQLQQFVQNEHLELYAGSDTDNIEPIASFIDSLLSGCVGANEWGLQPVEGTYTVDASHFTHNTAENVAQSHSVIQLEPQLNGMANSYLPPYNQVQQVQVQAQQVQVQPQQVQVQAQQLQQQYQQQGTPVTETHTTTGYHPVPQMQSVQNQAGGVQVQTPKKKNNNTKPNAVTPEDQKQAALNRRREKRKEQRLKKLAEKNAIQQQAPPPQQQQQSNAVAQTQAPPPSTIVVSLDNPTPVTSSTATRVDNSLRNEVRAAVEGTYETLVSSHSLSANQYQSSYGTAVDTPMSTPTENTRVNSTGGGGGGTPVEPALNVQMNYQMTSGMHNLMDTVQVATVGTAVDTPVVTPAGTPLPVTTLEWSSQLYHPAPNQAIPVNDGSTAYTTLNVATMNIGDVHTYLPIDFNELSHTTTTLQPLDPTIVITNSATSPNAPVLSIPQPMVPLGVEDSSFFDTSLINRSNEIHPQTPQQVFSNESSMSQDGSNSKQDGNGGMVPVSPRIKSERTPESVEAAKQDRLAKRREKYRQQQEMKKKGLTPQPVEKKKSQPTPEVLAARRKRELDRRKEKRKQAAEQKKQLLQQNSGSSVTGSNSVPKAPLVIKAEVRAEDVVVPSVSSGGSSVPSNDEKPVSASDNAGPGVTSPEQAQTVCGGEPGALSASGVVKQEAVSVGMSNVIIGQEAVIGSVLTHSSENSHSQAGLVRETLQPPEQFRRSATDMLSTLEQEGTTAAVGVTTSATTSHHQPVFKSEGPGSTAINFQQAMTVEHGEFRASQQDTFAPYPPLTYGDGLYSNQGPAIPENEQYFQLFGTEQQQQHTDTLGFLNFPPMPLEQLPSVSSWESQISTPTSSSCIGTVDVKPVAKALAPPDLKAPLVTQRGTCNVDDSEGSGLVVEIGIGSQPTPAGTVSSPSIIENLPGTSRGPLKTSQSPPEEIEAKKSQQRGKQRESKKMRKLKQEASVDPSLNDVVPSEIGEPSKFGKESDSGNKDTVLVPLLSAEEMKEQRRLKNLKLQRERRQKLKEQKKQEVLAAEKKDGDREEKGKIKFIKVDHSPQVQSCPDCDFKTDTHYKLMVHKTVHDALNVIPPFVKSVIEATGKVDYLLKYQPDRDPFQGTKLVKPPKNEVKNDPV